MLTLVGILFATASVSALSYEESRNRAWYLTDKMAYELNLTPEQYDKAYEINLNYFLNVNYASDIDGLYWRYRNQDLGYVLFDWQFSRFAGISYFYRPLIWRSGICIMTTYDYYDRGFYYFNRPAIYNVYRGVSWRKRPKHSPYRHMTFSANGGMRERYGDRGHGYYFRNGERFDAPRYNGEHYGHRDNLRKPGPDFDKDMMVKPRDDRRDNNRFDNRNNNNGRDNGRVYGNGGNFRDKIENSGRKDNSSTAPDRNENRFNSNTTSPGNNNLKPDNNRREDNSRFVYNRRDNSSTGNIRTSGSNTRSNYGSSKSYERNGNSTPNRFGTRTETSSGNGGRSFSDRIRSSSSNSRSNAQNAPASSPSRSTSPSVRSTSPSRNSGGNSGGGNTRTRSFGR